ncbi:protein disulfide isomerase [Schizosaccharomyces cryophilus OY26]|uniref:protein disulfide-isomerase n=1 Tax=Schizosaccharomyces cryophilus (strain OY26 / ATCC MYA-4695 / CBS 11777 / NBRC 106824 / NRRL Y48691) TaxID=653667 RepID=S9W0X4_SCHCR|nr:protein disulfide isomerase [Schizosaccharomyces cryophilus OY26]EPY51700.1 protein disulfide isomerase [Schizosaccharomyces cryophilus OY26]
MKVPLLVTLSFWLFALVAAKNVFEFTGLSQLENGIRSAKKGALIEFYAPWCGHCKNLLPVYEELGQTFEEDDDILIGKIDADTYGEVGKKYQIRGFPTLIWYPADGSDPEQYSHARDLDSLTQFVSEKTGVKKLKKNAFPSSVVELDSASFDKIVMDDTKDVLVEFYADWCGYCKRLAPTYEKLASVFKNEPNVEIAKVNGDIYADIGMKHQVASFPTIKLFQKGRKDKPDAYNGDRSLESLTDYLNEKTGTQRSADGSLLPSAGRITILDDFASEFVDSSRAAKEVVFEKVKQFTMENRTRWTQYYRNVFEKALKDESWVTKEAKRLSKILRRRSIALANADDFKARLNILRSFISSRNDDEL